MVCSAVLHNKIHFCVKKKTQKGELSYPKKQNVQKKSVSNQNTNLTVGKL